MTNEAELSGLTEVQRELFDLARETNYQLDGLNDILSPDWESDERRHWASYVPETVFRNWKQLPLEAQILASIAAWEARNSDPDYQDY